MENKQTAVEWLEEQMIISNFLFTKRLFEQAKQMEKEQHEDTWFTAQVEFGEDLNKRKYFEDYYNETYGKDNR